MHPILFHLGHIAVPTEGVLVAFGLLAGLQLACLLAPHRGIHPDRIWNLGLASLLTLFLGERIFVIALNLHDFLDHPVWMLGLATVRDERYFYGGVLLAICTGIGYISAWRLPWRSVLDVLAPGGSFAFACASLGSLAAGVDLGRPTTAAWGITYTNRLAARFSGTPLGVPLIPTALYAALLYSVLAAGAVWLCLRPSRPDFHSGGSAAAIWLFGAGLGAFLLDQLRYRLPNEVLMAEVFTPAQTLGVLAVCLAALIWLRPAAVPEAVSQ